MTNDCFYFLVCLIPTFFKPLINVLLYQSKIILFIFQYLKFVLGTYYVFLSHGAIERLISYTSVLVYFISISFYLLALYN